MRLPAELYEYILPFVCEGEANVPGTEWRSKDVIAWAGVCRAFRSSVQSYVSPTIVLDGRLSEQAKEEMGNHMLQYGDIGKPLKHLHRLLCDPYYTRNQYFRLIDPTSTTILEILDEMGDFLAIETWFESYWAGSNNLACNIANIFEDEEKKSKYIYDDSGEYWILEEANTILLECLKMMPNLQHVTWGTGLPFLLEKRVPAEQPGQFYAITYETIPQMNSVASLLSKYKSLISLTFQNDAPCDLRTLGHFSGLKSLDINTDIVTTGTECDDADPEESSFLKRIFEHNKNLRMFSFKKSDEVIMNPRCLPYWATLEMKYHSTVPLEEWNKQCYPEYLNFPKAITSLQSVLVQKRNERNGRGAVALLTGRDIQRIFDQDDTFTTFKSWCQKDDGLAEEVAKHFNRWYDKKRLL